MDRLASMETFVRVVEMGSFSGAARQLRVGQPVVSKSIAQLEGYLGVKLLTRSTRGLTPTEAGLAYLERARLKSVVDFEMFWEALEAAAPRAARSKGGRPPFDHVLMFARGER
jgi:DNA-binding transcriptional LysR family regulator